MKKILIIDPSEKFCVEITLELRQLGHNALWNRSLDQALASDVGLVALNARMPDGNAIDLIPRIRQEFPAPEVIIVSEQPDANEAETAIKNGAWDYVEKPQSVKELASILDNAIRYASRSKLEPSHFESGGKHFDGIVGNSPQLRSCLDIVAGAANSDANVLIKGETGTGKELIACAIHRNSPRADGNFVVVDCASLPETLVESTLLGHERGAFTGADRAQSGLIKQADGGTLFLDEVGELPMSAQKSFLRVLEERRFRPIGAKEEVRSDFRLISATNRNLDEKVLKGEFREDLLFRLRSFAIEVPPLRQRTEDVRSIISYYMPKICERLGIDIKEISPEFHDALLRYSWPGNVRELVNSLERSIVAARTERILLPQHLPTYLRIQLARSSAQSATHLSLSGFAEPSSELASLPSLQAARESAVNQAEREYLQKLMRISSGDIKQACRISKLSRSRLYSLLKKHNIPS
jgi:two-component system, NtrC family, response regulator